MCLRVVTWARRGPAATEPGMRSRPLLYLAGLVLGAVFLWLSLQSIDVAASIRLVTQAAVSYEIVAVLASIAFMVVKAWRWRVLLAPLRKFDVGELIVAVYAGTAVNLMVSHVGELARAAIVSKRHGVPTSALLGSIALERLFDIVAVLLFLAVLAASPGNLAPILVSAGYFAVAIVALTVIAVAMAILWPERTRRCVWLALFFLPTGWRAKVDWHMQAALSSLKVVRSARLLPKVALLSLLQWSCILIGILASMRSLGLGTEAISAIAVLVLLVVGLALPAAPIHVGTTQMGFTFGLAVFEVGPQSAFAASIIYTLFVLLPMLLMGFAALHRSGEQLRSIVARIDPGR